MNLQVRPLASPPALLRGLRRRQACVSRGGGACGLRGELGGFCFPRRAADQCDRGSPARATPPARSHYPLHGRLRRHGRATGSSAAEFAASSQRFAGQAAASCVSSPGSLARVSPPPRARPEPPTVPPALDGSSARREAWRPVARCPLSGASSGGEAGRGSSALPGAGCPQGPARTERLCWGGKRRERRRGEPAERASCGERGSGHLRAVSAGGARQGRARDFQTLLSVLWPMRVNVQHRLLRDERGVSCDGELG